uniref:DUF1421 domain-containing protein n=1 Tax=Anthurium amnicola TaxID=1678845 RepID=A0A1D1ZH48_9ARAE
MASGGSSSRAPSLSRSFDFGSDDVLCSYDDLASQDTPNGKRSDSAGKDFRENRMGRPLMDVYGQQDAHDNRDLISAVEKCMKKYADNLLRFLEGISGRLSQLELYCYNLERSIGDLRSDLGRDQSESDLKLKSLEKHVQEVHRSVQILRDKQELAEYQKELAKLQLAQKESSEGAGPAASEPKKHVDSQDPSNQQLALALPQQPTPPSTLQARTTDQSLPYKELPQAAPTSLGLQQDPYVQTQGGPFYAQRNQLLNQMPPQQHQQNRTLQPEQQYVAQRPQPQDLSRQPQQQLQQPHTANQVQHHSLPQYEQPWAQQPSQQFSQQVIQPRPGAPQSQIRPETPSAISPYPSNSPGNSLPEIYPGSMPMQAPYIPVPQSAGNRQPAESFGYGGLGSTAQLPPAPLSLQRQQVPATNPSSLGPQVNKSGYPGTVPYPQHTNVQGYVTHGSDGIRAPHSQHFLPASYPPSSIPMPPVQSQPPPNVHAGLQMVRNHPYTELVEKAVNMGYVRDHVVSVIRGMEESGQPVDFNSMLDMLNARPAGASQRAW